MRSMGCFVRKPSPSKSEKATLRACCWFLKSLQLCMLFAHVLLKRTLLPGADEDFSACCRERAEQKKHTWCAGHGTKKSEHRFHWQLLPNTRTNHLSPLSNSSVAPSNPLWLIFSAFSTASCVNLAQSKASARETAATRIARTTARTRTPSTEQRSQNAVDGDHVRTEGTVAHVRQAQYTHRSWRGNGRSRRRGRGRGRGRCVRRRPIVATSAAPAVVIIA